MKDGTLVRKRRERSAWRDGKEEENTKEDKKEDSRGGGGVKMRKRRWWRSSYPASCPFPCVCPAMASMMASCEYMLMGVLYWAWMMVAFPPGPFTSMGLWVERAVSRAPGLKPALMGGGATWRRTGGDEEEREEGEVKT